MDFCHLTSLARSDPGRKRKSNEDAILCLPEAGVFCVADGMGGAAGGQLASRWTVESVQRAFPQNTAAAPDKTARMRQALNDASRRIRRMAEEQAIIGAGTTAVVLLFDDYQPDRATVLHAGDSRAYRMRAGRMECLTLDHSLAASAGLPHDRDLPAMFRGIITRAIGLNNTVELDEAVLQVQAGDCYLLCSDGLTKMIADHELQQLVRQTPAADLERLAAALVDAANHAGGEDNISVILVRVGPLPAPIPRPDAAGAGSDPAEKTAPAQAAAPPNGEGGPEQPPRAGGSAPGHLPPETGELLAGVTPPSGHTSTASAPPPPAASAMKKYLLAGILLASALGAAYFAGSWHQRRSRPPADVAGPAAPAAARQPAVAPAPVPAADLNRFLNRLTGEENRAAWKAEWAGALKDPAQAAAARDGYRQAIATLCAQAGLPPPPAAEAPGARPAEEQAAAHCVQIYELLQDLQSKVEIFTGERLAELAVFGNPPLKAIENLRRLSGQPAPSAADQLAALQQHLQLVVNWLAENRQRVIPLDEIRGGPPSVLPRILAQRNELWAAVRKDLEACGPALARQLEANPGDPLLNNLGARRQFLLKDAAPGANPAPWPGKERLPALEGFFGGLAQSLERAD